MEKVLLIQPNNQSQMYETTKRTGTGETYSTIQQK